MDWQGVDRSLGETYHLTPLQCDELTLAEIAVLLDQKGRLSGTPKMSDSEIVERARRRLKMTPKEKLLEKLSRG